MAKTIYNHAIQAKKMSYEALTAHLKFNKYALCRDTENNNMPDSFEEIKSLLGVANPEAYMEHTCGCGRTLFSKCQSRREWTAHIDDKCDLCEGRRFGKSINNSGELVLVPNCFFYYFGLKQVLEK